jgi:hypothetical protein
MSWRHPRLFSWFILSFILLLVLFLVSPQQVPVALYKLTLISFAAVLGYHLDRALFPYARPDIYLCNDWRESLNNSFKEQIHFEVLPDYRTVFAVAMLRRAIIVAAVVIGVALGL